MKKSTLHIILALALVVLITVVPLLLVKDSEFGGADGQAGDIALEIKPDYEPWIDNFWAPPGGETESLLFALQAALGSGIFFFFLGHFAGQKKQAAKNKA